MVKKILIACEESQAVCIEFRKLGFEAYSCDMLPCSGGHPEWHIQDDVLKHLNDGWDLMIAFPPCTHLAVSGARWFKHKKLKQTQALEFVERLLNAKIDRIAIENPVGIISTVFHKPNQYIQPYEFGDTATKKTCLWLKNLPLLVPTKIIPKKQRTNEIWLMPPSADRGKLRSKTFPGIAKAMAEQWSKVI